MFGHGLPAGAKVLQEAERTFNPKKSTGKTILILDGHTSQLNCFEMLRYTEENDVILICVPSHTGQVNFEALFEERSKEVDDTPSWAKGWSPSGRGADWES